MEPLDDLLTKAQFGDVSAFTRIVRRYQHMAGGYAYAILGDAHLAEDAVQDAFIEVYTFLSRIYGGAAFAPFLRKVVYKHCDRVLRKRRPECSLEDVSVPSSPDTPEGDLEQVRSIRKVHRAFMALPLPERQAVVLYYINRHRRQEIALFLDLPLETVIYRLRSARDRLRKDLDTMNPDRISTIVDQPVEKVGEVAFAEIDAVDVDPDLALYVGKLKDLRSMDIKRKGGQGGCLSSRRWSRRPH